jgi:hypothetical protein
MSPSTRVGASVAARAVVALMRAVPALFTTGWLTAGAVWLVQSRLERALAALVVAAIAASLGLRIALASRADCSASRKGLETSVARARLKRIADQGGRDEAQQGARRRRGGGDPRWRPHRPPTPSGPTPTRSRSPT